MDAYCSNCFVIFRFLDSCPRQEVFQHGTGVDIFLEILWVFGSLLPPIIYASLLIYTFMGRTSRVLIFLMSLAIQQILNEVILKRILAEHRPKGACSHSFGLPSGHSAFSACWLTWLLLEWSMFHDDVPFKKGKVHTVLRTLGIIVTPLIPISRYFLNYHSIKQICYGLLTGFCCALLTFTIVVTLIHLNEGHFWSRRVSRFLKKLKIKENILHIEEVLLENVNICIGTPLEPAKELAKEPAKEPAKMPSRDVTQESVVEESVPESPKQNEIVEPSSPIADIEAQQVKQKQHKIVLPLREGVRRLFCFARPREVEARA